jgi:Flp pilus assembly CpaF family ATPase
MLSDMVNAGHDGFIAFLRANANSQRVKRVSRLGVSNRNNKAS